MVIEGRHNEEKYYARTVKNRPACFFQQPKSLLIMDSAKSHLGDVPEVFTRYNTECKIIDVGMIPLLQFLDAHVNKPFKDILKERWAEWIASGTEEFTKQGKTIAVHLMKRFVSGYLKPGSQ